MATLYSTSEFYLAYSRFGVGYTDLPTSNNFCGLFLPVYPPPPTSGGPKRTELAFLHICPESSSFNNIISAADISCMVAELEV